MSEVHVRYNRLPTIGMWVRPVVGKPVRLLESMTHVTVQPGFSKGPITLHSNGRDTQQIGNLLDAQSREIPQLHNLRFALVERFQSLKCAVQGKYLFCRCWRG